MRTAIPVVVGLIVVSLWSWRIRQDAVRRLSERGNVEITVYSPGGAYISIRKQDARKRRPEEL